MIEQINFKSVLDFTKMSVNEIEKLQNIKDETDKFAFVRKKKLRKVLFTLSGEEISIFSVV
jgi:hypothetical protein